MSIVEEIREAILNEGPHPSLHKQIMAKHRKEWPTLWRALDKLMAAEVEPNGWPFHGIFPSEGTHHK